MKIDTSKGLRYNANKRQWSLVHFPSLEPMVQVLEYGAHKYSIFEDENGNEIKGSEISIEEAKNYKLIISGKDNWKKGLGKDKILESLQRHLIALFEGEENDPESGLPHIGHLMCNALFYSYESKNLK